MIDIAKEQERTEASLLKLPNVVGVGLGHKYTNDSDTGQNAVVVLVNQKLPPEMLRGGEMISAQVGAYPTDVVDVGEIFAQPLDAPVTQLMGAANELGPVPVLRPASPVSAEPQVLKRRVRPVMGGYSVAHTAVTAGTIATGCYDESAFPGIPGKYYVLSNNHVLANSNAAMIGDPIVQPGPIDGGTMPSDFIGL